ncbi:ATP-binding protein [Chitinimonas viridis]|uniref:histidine kinase n=1 Tax=Chitinimonas viridis TaxID=664880 RepID=A0ABT8BBN1_9NEIS|nr:ATP-binding protein [Chitinimonas viridis]MDN3578894.1 ATP-binding protein [Chitinimonas viridis]
MPRMRSIGLTLFIAISLTVLMVVLVLAGLFRLSLGKGFDDYVAKLELTRLDVVEQVLTERYQRHGDWRFIHSQQDLLPGPDFNRPPPPRGADAGPGRLPPRREDRLGLGPRLALFDAQGQLLMGPPEAQGRPRRPIKLEGGEQPIGYMALAPAGGGDILTRQFLASQTRNMLWSVLAAFILSALAAAWLARHFRAPIAALAQSAKQLAAGQLQTRVALERADELGQLARDFNRMAEQLQQFEQSRRQWMADTSHELRTPLTILRAHIEAMNDGVMPMDQRGLTRLQGAVGELDGLVADLYQLARADVGLYEYKPEPIVLASLFEELADRLAHPLRQAGLRLSLHVPAELAVQADPAKIQQLFGNLLSNTLRYTDTGGEIRLSASAQGASVEIILDDSAPGVPDAALPRLFERFYRVDASRSRQYGGSGLGLAICLTIVEGHGGQINAQHSPLGGLRIQIQLPRAPGATTQ